MLTLGSELAVGQGRYRDAAVLYPRYRLHVVRRDRLVYDAAFAPETRPSREFVHLVCFVAGQAELAGCRRTTPVAVLMTSAEFAGGGSAGPSYRSWGDPALSVELTLPAAALRRPVGLACGPVELGAATWEQIVAVAEAFAAGTALAPPLHILVQLLIEEGALDAELLSPTPEPSAAIQRVWQAVRTRYARGRGTTTLLELAAASGVSAVQVARDFATLLHAYPYLGASYRDVVRVLRLRAALGLLSAPGAAVEEVARAVGYGSVAAMRRAFRDASMAAPTAIRRACAYRHGEPRTAAEG
ncbi:MAG: helix-turn-helix domain-containing protein [Kofleriaceae bacterium]